MRHDEHRWTARMKTDCLIRRPPNYERVPELDRFSTLIQLLLLDKSPSLAGVLADTWVDAD
jgi:hypothetical protein